MKTGCELIQVERQRQMEAEGWTPGHDDQHPDGALAMAAVCYAAPDLLYHRAFTRDWKGRRCYSVNGLHLVDPWPWESRWDKRMGYGDRRENPGNIIPDPDTYSDSERLGLLVKAGALIAAEVDRLLRARKAAASED